MIRDDEEVRKYLRELGVDEKTFLELKDALLKLYPPLAMAVANEMQALQALYMQTLPKEKKYFIKALEALLKSTKSLPNMLKEIGSTDEETAKTAMERGFNPKIAQALRDSVRKLHPFIRRPVTEALNIILQIYQAVPSITQDTIDETLVALQAVFKEFRNPTSFNIPVE